MQSLDAEARGVKAPRMVKYARGIRASSYRWPTAILKTVLLGRFF